ncbi:MAG: hypothetical protein PHS54_01305 [Clostridia bacterium]|nr:hypothetical protein [Clostridia bacterium]
MNFSEDEKRFYELEYKKAFEKNKRFTVVSTRAIALLCVFALFFIGFAMMNAVKEYGQIKDQYGDQAFCYLCGLESNKKCECQYQSTMYSHDDFMLTEEYSLQLAEYNAGECKRSKIIGSQGDKKDLPDNFTINTPFR